MFPFSAMLRTNGPLYVGLCNPVQLAISDDTWGTFNNQSSQEGILKN